MNNLYSITTDDKRFLVIAPTEDEAQYLVIDDSYRATLDDDLPYLETKKLANCPKETEARILAECDQEEFPMTIEAWKKARNLK